jgi:molecular chaperone HtpG
MEINPSHPLIKGMAAKVASGGGDLSDLGMLLLDQALIVEGEAPADPVAFARRLSTVMTGAV